MAGKTGQAANMTLRAVGDGSEYTPAATPAEVDATNCPGLYKVALTAAESNYQNITLHGKCSTASTYMIPTTISTQINANVDAIDGNATASNSATLNLKQLNIVNNAGDAIIASATGGNGNGINASGNGTGNGGTFTSGSGAGSSGLVLLGAGTGNSHGLSSTGNTNGSGVVFAGSGSGRGIWAVAGATGAGIDAVGGGTSGDGIKASSTSGNGIEGIGGTNGSGLVATGAGTGSGIKGTGGATGHGELMTGGATSGNGAKYIAPTSGYGIEADAAGNGSGLYLVGSGSGDGMTAQAGTTGHGLKGIGGPGSGSHGIHAEGGTGGTGVGFYAKGGATGGGHGIFALATGDGSNGFVAQGITSGDGIKGIGGDTGNGIHAIGGATSGDGILGEGNTSGHGLHAIGGSNNGNGATFAATTAGCGLDVAAAGAWDGARFHAGTQGYGIDAIGAGAYSGILAQGGATDASGFKIRGGGAGLGLELVGTPVSTTIPTDVKTILSAAAVTLAASQPNYAPSKAGDAMSLVANQDVRNVTGTLPNVTLAASQASYAPAKAGDKMDIVNAPNATAIAAIQSGLATDAHVQANNAILTSATYGNAAIKTELDTVHTDTSGVATTLGTVNTNTAATQTLAAGSSGFAAIKGDTSAIKSDLETTSTGMIAVLGTVNTNTATIKTDVESGTTGLAAIKGDTAAIKSDLESGSIGLAVIKSDTAAIKSDVESSTFGLAAIKSDLDALEASSGSVNANIVAINGQATNGYNATLKLKQLDIENNSGDALIAKATGSGGIGFHTYGNGAGSGQKNEGGINGNGTHNVGGGTSGSGFLNENTAAGNVAMKNLANGAGSIAMLNSALGTGSIAVESIAYSQAELLSGGNGNSGSNVDAVEVVNNATPTDGTGNAIHYHGSANGSQFNGALFDGGTGTDASDLYCKELDTTESYLTDLTFGLPAIIGVLSDGTNGLTAIRVISTQIESDVENATTGLANIKADVDSINTRLDSTTYGLAKIVSLIGGVNTISGETYAIVASSSYGNAALEAAIAANHSLISDVDVDVEAIAAHMPSGLVSNLSLSTVIDTGVSLQKALQYVSSMVNGNFVIDTPNPGDITFYAADGTTVLFVVSVTTSGRTKV